MTVSSATKPAPSLFTQTVRQMAKKPYLDQVMLGETRRAWYQANVTAPQQRRMLSTLSHRLFSKGQTCLINDNGNINGAIITGLVALSQAMQNLTDAVGANKLTLNHILPVFWAVAVIADSEGYSVEDLQLMTLPIQGEA